MSDGTEISWGVEWTGTFKMAHLHIWCLSGDGWELGSASINMGRSPLPLFSLPPQTLSLSLHELSSSIAGLFIFKLKIPKSHKVEAARPF
jgi:hypothetical protein